jgi:ankyrin repeat protein
MASFGLGNPSAAVALVTHTAIDSSTPWMAASEGNLPLLRSSLDTLGLAATAQDETGYAIIHAAAAYNHMAIIKWLLDQGVNVDVVDQEGDGVLHFAGNAATAQFLVIQGQADPALLNAAGKTALQTKQEELEETMQDEDSEEEDDDLEALKGLVEYLKSL